jgi:hypothetical protein
MYGAIAIIGRCRSFQPSASSPQYPKSNREALRLEIHPTQRKQTTGHPSNRGNNACFSGSDQPTCRTNPKTSNRESLRLEIHPTRRKQRVRADDSARRNDDHHPSNRENNASFSNRVRAVNRLRDCRAIDSAQRNRVRADDSARRNIDQPNKIIQQEQSLPPRNPKTNAKNTNRHPSFLFRLKPTPIVCFLQFTTHFNRTMFVSITAKIRRTSRGCPRPASKVTVPRYYFRRRRLTLPYPSDATTQRLQASQQEARSPRSGSHLRPNCG